MTFVHLFVKENDSMKYARLAEVGGAYYTPPPFSPIFFELYISTIERKRQANNIHLGHVLMWIDRNTPCSTILRPILCAVRLVVICFPLF